jgi:amino acid adenylation domain-containing protein
MRLIARLRAVLEAEVSVRDLFAGPSPAALAALAALAARGGPARPAVAARPRDGQLPLSFGQQRMWFLNRLESAAAVYNMPLAVRLAGELDVAALRAALGDVAARHEILRTVYPDTDGAPCQHVLDGMAGHPVLTVTAATEQELPRLLAATGRQRFDLSRELPLRARLYTLRPNDQVLLLVVHHITADGWSMGVLARDLSTAYQARRVGQAPTWQPLPVQYADYTLWQRETLGSDSDPDSEISAQLTYWRQALAGLPPELALPADRPRPSLASFRGGSVPVRVSAAGHARLVEVAGACRATMFMTIQAAVALLLTKLGADEDIPIGTVIAGRGDYALNDLVGFFVNMLVLRADVSGNPSFTELIGRIRETDLAAYAHQDLPFERLVEDLNPLRSLARHPLFQVSLALQSAVSEARWEFPGLTVRPVRPGAMGDSARLDLLFTLGESRAADGTPAGIAGSLRYAADLFDRATAEAIAGWLGHLLEQVAATPDVLVSHIDVMSSAERELVMRAWNDTTRLAPEETLPVLFAAQARRSPDAVAVICGRNIITYAGLDAASGRLAQYLTGLGACPEKVVAVLMPRSADMVVALLGVLKAGAAYLPVDPDYPPARTGFMLADARPAMVVCTARTAAMLPADALTLPRIEVDDPATAAAIISCPDADPGAGGRRAALATGNPAYVIYTSGSTGTPKGVVISHAGIGSLAVSQKEAFAVRPGSRILQFASLSFDAAVSELCMALLSGAALVIAARDRLLPAEMLTRMVRESGITHVTLPPAVLAELPEGSLNGVSTLVAAGEACPAHLAAQWSAGRRMINAYGPTEATVCATMTGPLTAGGGVVPIGRPLANTRVFVLDAFLRPVPPGVTGEVYLAGAGLARGYLGRAGLTAERFTACPFPAAGGERMYRTGDLGRWTAGGELVFAGRADGQVKIRGFRVEPGEIEAVLARHPGIGQAAVVARENQPGQRQLVAYVVPAEGTAAPGPAALREHAARMLPDYMVPAAILPLAALPLTPSGKLDHGALPAPDFAGRVSPQEPRTPAEEVVCSLFAEVLGVDRVGPGDSFFDLGGDSLMSVRIANRIRAVLGTDIDAATLLTAPTPASLAQSLAVGGPPRAALAPVPRPRAVPLSFGQQRMWFLNRLESAAAVYNMPLAVRLAGELDVAALRAALGDVAARHEILRTVYPDTDGAPRQEILSGPDAIPPLEVRGTGEAGLAGMLAAAARAGFDVSAELPWRARLAELSSDDHVLALTLHHIAADGWSMGVLARDVSAAYAARRSGREPGRAPLPVQYADYAIWQRELLGAEQDPGSAAAAQLGYWRQALAGLPQELALPADRPRPAAASHRGGSVPVRVSAAAHAGLVRAARTGRATVFMVVQAAVALWLSRLGAGTDIPVGTAVAGRGDAQLDELVGFFVNTLVLRTDVAGNPAFSELIARAREASLGAYAHQDLPFERLVEDLAPARSLARHPLFQISIELHNIPREQQNVWDMPGLEAQPLQGGSGTPARFDLSVVLGERRDADGTPAGVGGALRYAVDLFDQDTAEALATWLARVAEQIAADPVIQAGRVELLSAEERRVVAGWNDTAAEVPAATVPELFAAQAARTPDAVAVVSAEETLSYAGLDAASSRLARYLVSVGAGPEKLVAVAVPRSVQLVVTLLGVLKAGAAYLPVDPDYPAQRIEFMLADARPVAIVSPSQTLAALPGASATTLIPLDDPAIVAAVDACQDTAPRDADRAASLSLQHPAYIIYTSGSTGTPKGVVVTHRGVASLAGSQSDGLGLHSSTRVLQFASLSFDAAFWELCMSLLSGAALVMTRPDRIPPGDSLAAFVRELGVTHMTLPPAVLAALPAGDDMPRSLRTLVLAGEACPPGLVDQWSPGRRMINAYGPTETTVCATMTQSLTAGGSVVPIGRPIWNTRAFVLDDFLRPVPPRATGELYLAGAGLARGYAGRAALTGERFVACPFPQVPGERMYRTGDLARWTRGGELVFAERADEQVKVRGFRVEPGEVETVLAAQQGVAQAVVIAREDTPGQKRLVGYVAPETNDCLDPAGLRERAASLLPEHMVPAAIVVLERLPLSPTGKVDRAALPVPDFAGLASADQARTPLEEMICGLFAEVLGVERAGPDDSFFDRGGDSLLAVRLIARLRAALDAEVSIRGLFADPTPAGVARRMSADSTARPALVPVTRPTRIPLSFAQQRMWFLNRFQEADASYIIPFAVRLTGDLDVPALAAALGDVARRHESLRTIFPETDGVPRQEILSGPAGDPVLPVAETTEDELPSQLSQETERPFDVRTDLPWRSRLMRLSPTEHVLTLIMHHIVADGWSMGVLTRDLSTAYSARRAGTAPDWAALPVQYADYALWQRSILGEEEDPDSLIAGQLAYWRRVLADLPAELSLPADRSRPATAGARADTARLQVRAQTWERLTDVAKDGRTTMFMVVQATVALLLSRLGAGTDIPIGTPEAGRGDVALDQLIGFFVNTLVLRTDLSGNPSFTDLMARVRETDLGAYAYQDVPFERLVEDLNPPRSPARHPLFQVSLTFQNVPRGAWSLPGLTVRPFHAGGAGLAKFDLSFTVGERRDGDGTLTGVDGVINYSADLFDPPTADGMAQRLVSLLDQVADDPGQLVSEFQVLQPAERHQVLEEWKGTARPEPDVSLAAAFSAQATQSPDAPAVVGADGRITYAELGAAADRLAAELTAAGVRPESRVALLMDWSADLVVAMLAVLKAGGVYVPLDPGWPTARLRLILRDTAPSAILADPALRESEADVFAAGEDRLTITIAPGFLLGSGGQGAHANGHRPGPDANPDQLAYLMYTSGSTGEPKGVAITQRDVLNLATDHCWHGGSHERVLVHSPQAFDASIYEVWVPLLSGGQLVLAPGELDPAALETLIARHQITALWLTAGLFRVIAEESPASLRQIREIWTGGDVVPPIAVRQVLQHCPDTVVVNGYGPTETTTFVTHHAMRADGLHATVPIGRPLDNTRALVLDRFLSPVPPGVTGELYLAGAGLARGYWNRAASTSERFVACPFGPPGERMYRTGDLARWGRQGRLVFAGRADDQVKIRGFRVEPGELETILARHEAVGQVAVLARDDGTGQRQLVAYVVPARDESGESGGQVDDELLREYLAEQLPEHMIPAAFLALDSLPLTPNGKLDRRALPAPDFSGLVSERGPSTAIEETLCAVFAEVLGLDRVGVDDSFFDLGGDSLLAFRLIAKVRTALSAELPIGTLFRSPTPAGLAGALGARATSGEFEVLLPLRAEGTRPPLFCVHAVEGISWRYAGLADHLPADQPIYGLQSRGLAHPEPLPRSMEEVAADYAGQIRSIQAHGPYYLLGWSLGGVIAHAVATHLQEQGEQIALLTILDGYPPLGRRTRPQDAENHKILHGSAGNLTSKQESVVDDVVALFRADGSRGEMTEDTRNTIRQVILNNFELGVRYTPRQFHGDILLFVSALGRPASRPAAQAPDPWRPYVEGRIESHQIDCDHQGMVTAGPLSLIGHAISSKIRETQARKD